VFYEFDEATGEPALTGLTIEIARLLETELNCKFEFILGSPERPEVRILPRPRAARLQRSVPAQRAGRVPRANGCGAAQNTHTHTHTHTML